MPVRIINQNNNFLLEGSSRGFLLTIDCSEQIRRYNSSIDLLQTDCRLYQDFAGIDNQNNLSLAIDNLIHSYGLHRRPVFNGNTLSPILIEYLENIRTLPFANNNSLSIISERFVYLRNILTERLNRNSKLPEVTLSKLLHFINPNSFGIIDSRVNSIIEICGYRASYNGFYEFLRDLMEDINYDAFSNLVLALNQEQMQQNNFNMPNHLLKIIDKVLWFTNE